MVCFIFFRCIVEFIIWRTLEVNQLYMCRKACSLYDLDFSTLLRLQVEELKKKRKIYISWFEIYQLSPKVKSYVSHIYIYIFFCHICSPTMWKFVAMHSCFLYLSLFPWCSLCIRQNTTQYRVSGHSPNLQVCIKKTG